MDNSYYKNYIDNCSYEELMALWKSDIYGTNRIFNDTELSEYFDNALQTKKDDV